MTQGASGAGERWVAVELCAGLGGIGIGLRALGLKVAKAYDSWDESVAIYNHNAPEPVAGTCNLLSKDGHRTVASDVRKLGGVDLLAAGPPCKGFSQLRNGHHDGRNGHNRVLASMPGYVALLRPRMFLIENVPDLARHRAGKTLRSLLDRLAHPARGLHYRAEYRVYDAALYGVPQVRRRMLLLGVREGETGGCLPEPAPDLARLYAAVRHGSQVPDELHAFSVALKDPENLTLTSARQALSDLPQLGAGEPEAERPYACEPGTAFQHWARRGSPPLLRNTQTPGIRADTVNRLKRIRPGGCARAIPEELLNGLSRRYDSAYRRLHPDAPSTALSTKYDCVYHYAVDRSLSVREYARLQGLPDTVTFPAHLACRRSAYEMIGNSVPPLLIERVLASVLGT